MRRARLNLHISFLSRINSMEVNNMEKSSAAVQEVKNETVDDKRSETMKDAKTLAIEAAEESFMNLTEEENIKASEEIKAMKAAGFMVKTAEKKSSATVEKEKKSATVEKEKKSATVEKTEDSKQFEALVKQAQSPSASHGLKQWLSDISSMAKLYAPDDDDVAQDDDDDVAQDK